MSKFSLLKYLLLALILWVWVAEAPAQELEVTATVPEGSAAALPPPVALSPAQSNSVDADEFIAPPNDAPPGTAMGPEEPEILTPPIPAPPPLPEVELAPPAAPPQALFTSAPAPQTIQSLTPTVEVWRDGSYAVQMPERYGKGRNHHQRLKPAVIAGNEQVTVRLQFDQSAVGKAVRVKAAWGLTVDPPDEVLTVDPHGQCTVRLTLEAGLPQSHLSFFCDGLTTTLPLARTSSEMVQAIEGIGGGIIMP